MTAPWKHGPRPPIGQYVITLTVTGDDVGPDALAWAIPSILHGNLRLTVIVDTIARYGVDAPATNRPSVRIHSGYERTVTVYVGDKEVATTNYDAVGWSGLDMIQNLARAIADAAGLAVTFCEGETNVCTCEDDDA